MRAQTSRPACSPTRVLGRAREPPPRCVPAVPVAPAQAARGMLVPGMAAAPHGPPRCSVPVPRARLYIAGGAAASEPAKGVQDHRDGDSATGSSGTRLLRSRLVRLPVGPGPSHPAAAAAGAFGAGSRILEPRARRAESAVS